MVGNSAYDWKTMPTPRSRGGTSLTHRPSKTTSPTSGRSKPAIIRSVVVLPHPDPPTTDTSSPCAISSDSPSTARAGPKHFVTPRSEMFTRLPGKLLQPLLDQAVLVLGRLDEVEVDQVHVRDLLAGNRDVGPRDAGPAPPGVGRHRRPAHRPVEEAPSVLRVLGALDQRVALERPRHAVRGEDDVDGRALFLGHLHL